jgi:uncharacterized protein YbcV (DUF1398 family)
MAASRNRGKQMKTEQIAIARDCHEGAETDRMTFPQSVAKLMDAGFDGYLVDLRRAARTFYVPGGESLDFSIAKMTQDVASRFDVESIRAAIREAQALAPGYTYRRFCAKVAAAGCAGYLGSFPGRRVLYFGRTGETHVEHFPGAQSQAEAQACSIISASTHTSSTP